EAQGQWSGTASELLAALGNRVSDQTKREKAWPKNPRSLSGHLKRLAPNLRTMGWILDKDRTSKKRCWTITRLENANGFVSLPSSILSQGGMTDFVQSDANWSEARGGDANDADDANSGQPWNPDNY